jgi:hypothetical protein
MFCLWDHGLSTFRKHGYEITFPVCLAGSNWLTYIKKPQTNFSYNLVNYLRCTFYEFVKTTIKYILLNIIYTAVLLRLLCFPLGEGSKHLKTSASYPKTKRKYQKLKHFRYRQVSGYKWSREFYHGCFKTSFNLGRFLGFTVNILSRRSLASTNKHIFLITSNL